MQNIKTIEQCCPKCHLANGEVMGVGLAQTDRPMKVGDFTICKHCATILEFDEGMNLVIPLPTAMVQLWLTQPDAYLSIMEAQQYIQRLTKVNGN